VFDLFRLGRGLAMGFTALSFVAATPPGTQDARVLQRSSGGDVVTARKIAAALLSRTLPAQLMRVRCERDTGHVDCGLIVSGTKFHRTLDLAAWNAEIAGGLVASAYAAVPELDEVDCWATVPLDAGKGAVVSGDFAQPTSATVFSITVPRAQRTGVSKRLAAGEGIFWDPAFRAALSKGTNG
jgi:hypothetical protein